MNFTPSKKNQTKENMSVNVFTPDDEIIVQQNSSNIKNQLAKILGSVNALEMTSEEAYNRVTSIYNQAKTWEKMVDDQRKKCNAPEQALINARNDKAKEILDPLKEIQAMTKKKAAEYQAFIDEQRKKNEEAVAQAASMFEVDVPYTPSLSQKALRGEGAVATTRTVRKFRIVDLHKVPIQYLKVDEDEVRQAIKMGIAHIDGIEIYDEKVTNLMRR